MEKGEPTFVPEWLKASTGSSVGGVSTPHHLNSNSQSDDSPVMHLSRNRSSHLQFSVPSVIDYDAPRPSSFVEKSSTSHFRRSSSSNGSLMHDKDTPSYSRTYNSFGRNHRGYAYELDKDIARFDRSKDRERDWEKDRTTLGDLRDRDRDYVDPLTNNVVGSRLEKETLCWSQSTISGKKGERSDSKVKRPGNDLGGTNNGLVNSGGLVSSMYKATFERDFPSLGSDDKHGRLGTGAPDICRVPSPGLTTVAQGLPLGSASVIGGDGWTSALVEVPVIIGSNSSLIPSAQQTSSVNAASVPPNTHTGLNMAETLAQAPARARSTPQLSIETQKLEELAIKQSRQLIPVIPSMSAKLALGSSDKAKPKTVRPGSLLVNSVRGPVRPDSPKSSQGGKLLVLKPNREVNGISPTLKDSLASSTKVPLNSASISPSAGSGSNNSKYTKPVADRKSPVLSAGQIFDEKRSSTQGQNRTEFFNSLRRKTANATTSSVQPNHGLPSNADKLEVQDGEVVSVDQMKDIHDADIEPALQDNGDVCEESISILGDEKKDDDLHGISVAPEEEEAAFLRSLGWDEGAGEEALTEEEINSFYELMKQRPSASFHQRVQYFKDGTSEPNAISSAGSTSGLSSSDSETDG
ncbi:uncharacterized protein LOC116262305 [Nymphaea colorata]|nr:uncharacterized protein LOC116262305 [Nymphaea colorata]